MSDLTDKQRVFIEEYLQCWNATEAARRAGYEGNDITLASVGYENLRKPQIAQRIKQRLQEKVMSADEVLSRLSEQARCEYTASIGKDGKVDLSQLKAAGKMHLVKGIKETKYGRQVEFYDGQTALIQIGKHHGLFTDKVDVGPQLEDVLRALPDGFREGVRTALTEAVREK